jgi:IclR family pca regulon transcriptional regulator
MGRVLLAGLPEAELDTYLRRVKLEPLTPYTITGREELAAVVSRARQDGYALVDQELEEGIRSVAAPIKNGRGETIAAMNVSGHASRVSVGRMRKEYLPRLLATAAEVSDRVATLRLG